MVSRFATPWEENKKVALVGKGAAEVLGYSNTAKANRDHIDTEDKQSERIVLSGQHRLINEGGFYSLILRSDMPRVIGGGNNMVKAKDIIRIKKEYEKYKKLLENETDIVKRLKYGRMFREYEYKVLQIELQLNNIEIGLYKEIELHKNIFVDRYIKEIPVERLVDKYRLSRTTIYRISNKAKELFERNSRSC